MGSVRQMSSKKKLLLAIVLSLVIGLHVALFAAGGSWRTVGLLLVALDVISGLFVIGAIREFRKLEEKKD